MNKRPKQSRIPSPARSHSAIFSPRRHSSRRSVGSPSGVIRLSALRLTSNFDNGVSLSDNTDISRHEKDGSWWKLLDRSPTSQEMQEGRRSHLFDDLMVHIPSGDENHSSEPRSVQNLNFELTSEASGDNISLSSSLTVRQRKLFKKRETVQENETLKKIIQTQRHSEDNSVKNGNEISDEEKTMNLKKKNFFTHAEKRREFPVELTSDRKKYPQVVAQNEVGKRNFFSKKKTEKPFSFEQFIMNSSDSEQEKRSDKPDEKINRIDSDSQKSQSKSREDLEQQKSTPFIRPSEGESTKKPPSPTNSIASENNEFDDWKMLPSSTMIDMMDGMNSEKGTPIRRSVRKSLRDTRTDNQVTRPSKGVQDNPSSIDIAENVQGESTHQNLIGSDNLFKTPEKASTRNSSKSGSLSNERPPDILKKDQSLIKHKLSSALSDKNVSRSSSTDSSLRRSTRLSNLKETSKTNNNVEPTNLETEENSHNSPYISLSPRKSMRLSNKKETSKTSNKGEPMNNLQKNSVDESVLSSGNVADEFVTSAMDEEITTDKQVTIRYSLPQEKQAGIVLDSVKNNFGFTDDDATILTSVQRNRRSRVLEKINSDPSQKMKSSSKIHDRRDSDERDNVKLSQESFIEGNSISRSDHIKTNPKKLKLSHLKNDVADSFSQADITKEKSNKSSGSSSDNNIFMFRSSENNRSENESEEDRNRIRLSIGSQSSKQGAPLELTKDKSSRSSGSRSNTEKIIFRSSDIHHGKIENGTEDGNQTKLSIGSRSSYREASLEVTKEKSSRLSGARSNTERIIFRSSDIHHGKIENGTEDGNQTKLSIGSRSSYRKASLEVTKEKSSRLSGARSNTERIIFRRSDVTRSEDESATGDENLTRLSIGSRSSFREAPLDTNKEQSNKSSGSRSMLQKSIVIRSSDINHNEENSETEDRNQNRLSIDSRSSHREVTKNTKHEATNRSISSPNKNKGDLSPKLDIRQPKKSSGPRTTDKKRIVFRSTELNERKEDSENKEIEYGDRSTLSVGSRSTYRQDYSVINAASHETQPAKQISTSKITEQNNQQRETMPESNTVISGKKVAAKRGRPRKNTTQKRKSVGVSEESENGKSSRNNVGSEPNESHTGVAPSQGRKLVKFLSDEPITFSQGKVGENNNQTTQNEEPHKEKTALEKYLDKIRDHNLLRKQKMEEFVSKSLRTTNYTENQNQSIIKTLKAPKKPPANVKAKKMRPQLIVDGKVYRTPKLYKPKPWANKRLYKYLMPKLEPKYNLSARVRAEKFVKMLSETYSRVLGRDKKNSKQLVRQLQCEMARLGFVKTYIDFYNFCEDYLPLQFRMAVIPDLVNLLPLPSRGVYAPILEIH